ncbi:MAG: exodeoxyribonuclease VII small subunit [Bacilli bacterium]
MTEKKIKFEDKLNALEAIVKNLESGDVALEDAIDEYTKAMKLANECSNTLKSSEEKVNKILKENGKLEDFVVE